MLAGAANPMILAGVEVQRFGLQEHLLALLDRSKFPFVTGVLGKSVVSENHPQFVGVYAGALSPDAIRRQVEGADCWLAIGPLITDLSTGIFTQRIDPAHAIVIIPENLMVAGVSYPGIEMRAFLAALSAALTAERGDIPYAALAARLNLSEAATRMAVHRLRKRFREVFREEIAQTVAVPDEVEAEIRHLLAALAG